MKFKIIVVLFLCLLLIGAVSASENATNDISSSDVTINSISQTDAITDVSQDDENEKSISEPIIKYSNNTNKKDKTKINIIAKDQSDEVGNSIKYSIKAEYVETGEVAPSVQLKFAIKLSSGIVERNLTTNSSGETYVTIILEPGSYPVTISSMDSNFDADPVYKTVTVTKIAGVLESNNRTIEYNSESPVIFTLKNKKTGAVLPNVKVSFRIYTGSTYMEYGSPYKDNDYKTDSNGQIVFTTPLNVGKHKIVMSVIDPLYEADTITRYVTVKKTTGKFTADNLETYYESGKKFTINLTNTKLNKPIYNGNVLIKIYTNKNQYYEVIDTTNINGSITFSIPSEPGEYSIAISSNDEGYSADEIIRQIIITKIPVNISGDNDNQNPDTGTNGNNNNQNADLQKELVDMKNQLKTLQNQLDAANKQNTKPKPTNTTSNIQTIKIIASKKITFKSKIKVKKYTITLKNKNKPIKKATVKLTIKGKKYTIKTNNKGKATFKIKNLKKKGKYTAVIIYKKIKRTVKIIVK